jgi:hypothetical protein
LKNAGNAGKIEDRSGVLKKTASAKRRRETKGASMEEITARALLVPAADVGDGLTTSVSRSEIEEVLESEEAPIELVLGVTRFSDGKADGTHNVAVSWERTDLEQLLQQAQGDEVTLTFDREALRQAVESDVEGHGIRETVLALAVAATAATGAAATAAAEPGPLLGGGAQISQSASPDDRAVPMASPTAEASVGVDDRAVARSAPTPDPVLGVDDRAVPRTTPVQAPSVAPDDRAVPRATPAPTSTPTSAVSPDDRAVPRSTPIEAPVVGTATDTGISWAPSPAETAALAGAIALAITGAFFVVGGRRRMRPGPA